MSPLWRPAIQPVSRPSGLPAFRPSGLPVSRPSSLPAFRPSGLLRHGTETGPERERDRASQQHLEARACSHAKSTLRAVEGRRRRAALRPACAAPRLHCAPLCIVPSY